MISEALALQKLKHRRRKRLRYTVDLIDKKNAFLKAGLVDFIVDRSNNFTQSVFSDRIRNFLIIYLLYIWEAYGTLSRMVSDSI